MEADSPSSSNRQWWNRLWSLKLPKKVKIFAWRFINDALPTAANLMHRKISTSSACSLCLGAWECVGHALFCCTRAKAIWKISKCQVLMPNIVVGNVSSTTSDLFCCSCKINEFGKLWSDIGAHALHVENPHTLATVVGGVLPIYHWPALVHQLSPLLFALLCTHCFHHWSSTGVHLANSSVYFLSRERGRQPAATFHGALTSRGYRDLPNF
ncbi:hypothetical protein F8388_018161 [Cannabis sativa]|uniref:Reverse transcriptase zinc-binding domain-containing protein n=1 Tax=Cannabis sativa TaxID=3483 RepID=A0A7J6GAZ8_CANSA|nr:hypothetical protein F8388_018161 [Cannabis sativa]